MPIVYRAARAEELQRAEELVVRSINDLSERHGFGPMAGLRPPHFQLFSLKDDPRGLWIADDDGEIRGFAFSWICGDLWFLAELFVAPGGQGHGVGNELLKRTFDHAQNAGARTKALITFAFNTVSQGLYIRHGLFPRMPIYFVSGARDVVASRLKPTPLRAEALHAGEAHMRCLADIDAGALGVSRAKHHRYLMEGDGPRGFLLHDGDACVGYAYVADGHVGPLAVTRPEVLGAAFTTALGHAADAGSAKLSAFLPGTCVPALSEAFAHGMRITFPMLLMASRDFGDWTRYLPRNPGFM